MAQEVAQQPAANENKQEKHENINFDDATNTNDGTNIMYLARLDGIIIASSENVKFIEDVVYFPKHCIVEKYFIRTKSAGKDPKIGRRSFYSITVNDTKFGNVAYFHSNPTDKFKYIADHIAFYTSKGVEISQQSLNDPQISTSSNDAPTADSNTNINLKDNSDNKEDEKEKDAKEKGKESDGDAEAEDINTNASYTYRAVFNGVIIAKSDNIIKVSNNEYFPSDSIKNKYFNRTRTIEKDEIIGAKRFYAITVKGKKELNAAYFYQDPNKEYKHIKGYVAFDKNKGVAVKKKKNVA